MMTKYLRMLKAKLIKAAKLQTQFIINNQFQTAVVAAARIKNIEAVEKKTFNLTK